MGENNMLQGNLYIISAPSGAGKSSLISALLKRVNSHKMMVSVSHTTRLPRPGEQEGVHYYFVSHNEFENLIEQNAFLEYAKVFGGNYYGTSLFAIEENLAKGIDVFLDIDWQGAQQIREKVPHVKSIFILRCPTSDEKICHLVSLIFSSYPVWIKKASLSAFMKPK